MVVVGGAYYYLGIIVYPNYMSWLHHIFIFIIVKRIDILSYALNFVLC